MNLLIQWITTSFLLISPFYLYYLKWISDLTFKFTLLIIALIAFVLPIVFRCSLTLQRGVLYLNFLDTVKNKDLKHPEKYNLKGRNFYIKNEDVTLGAWHLLPSSLLSSNATGEKDFEHYLGLGYPIFVYLHGNIGTRASDHRIELYKILSNLDCHVITFDYRSYGDSTYKTPNEKALANDGVAVYKWVLAHAKNSPIFVWGHSLGTGLATGMVNIISTSGTPPKGVILEAPFDNMPSEILVHPFGTIFRMLPWYKLLFSQPYYTNDEDFYSSKYILEFSSPVFILHAEDDGIIPSHLGQKLYNFGKKFRKPNFGPMEIKIFPSHYKYGHKFICRAPELPELIQNFIQKHKNKIYK